MNAQSAPQIALETSVRAASVAVDLGGRVAERSLEPERSHASDLLPALSEILQDLGTRPADLQLVVVGLGPGSYTGLRVGVATALGLMEGTGADLVGVPSVEALAFRHLAPGEEGCVVLDARGGELYYARYARGESDVRVLEEPCALGPDALAERLPRSGPIFGDPGTRRAAKFDEATSARLRTDLVPDARAVLQLGQARYASGGAQDPAQVSPLYLRPFGVKTRKR
ncbi:MAG: tRNA threonylcarbamoyladenosine biosynthesis protein TsaB [Planctomycetota bacterium]